MQKQKQQQQQQTQQQINSVAVELGLLLAGNGILLALSPGRFATLRRNSMLPERYNTTLDRLAVDDSTGRAAGTTAAMAGVALIAFGLKQTQPRA